MKTDFRKLLIVMISLAFLFTACSKEKPEATAPEGATSSSDTQPQLQVEPGPPVTGKVIEFVNGGGFTFVLLDIDGQQSWAAVPGMEFTTGEQVTLINTSVFPNFHSKSLDRDFENIIFASAVDGKEPKRGMMPAEEAAIPAHNALVEQGANFSTNSASSFGDALKAEGSQPMTAPVDVSGIETGSAKAVVDKATITVDRAPGANGFTVAELFDKAAELDGKKVVLNGKVMKVSANIMGRNWIHLQDGSGDPARKTHDLVVTTNGTTEMDQVVAIEGVLRANKDFGAGYKYDVIIEDAQIRPM